MSLVSCNLSLIGIASTFYAEELEQNVQVVRNLPAELDFVRPEPKYFQIHSAENFELRREWNKYCNVRNRTILADLGISPFRPKPTFKLFSQPMCSMQKSEDRTLHTIKLFFPG